MHDLQKAFIDTLVGGLRRKSVTTPSRWAERYREMGSPFPGTWTFERHPWLREVHNCEANVVAIQKAAQMGFTETVLNITFFKIDIERKDCLYILPSKTPDASDFSSARFDAALELSPHLETLFSDVKNVGHKRAGSANLYIRGSNSRSGLKSIPVSFMVFDEMDEMDEKNIVLAEERVAGQMQWQIFKLSTPTVPKKKINAIYEESTREHFFFKCPSCSKKVELLFPESLVILGLDKNDPDIKKSYLICHACKAKLDHEDKKFWLKNGIWIPTNTNSEIRGFHISQLYSSADKCRPEILAKAYLDSLDDVAKEIELFNSKLGLPHIPKGTQITDSEIIEAKGNRCKTDQYTETTKLITMGVDSGKWLHYEVDAWSFPNLGNDLNMNAVCEVLDQGKCLDFSELAQLMRKYQVMMCVIDAQPETRLAYEFACNHWGHVKLAFYVHSMQGKSISNPNDDSHRISVNRTVWMDVALNRFHNKTITVPKDIDAEYCEHLKNNIKRYKDDLHGNPVGYYLEIGPDHYSHARCYNEIALPLAASLATNTDIKGFL